MEQTLRLGGPYLFAVVGGCVVTAVAVFLLGLLVPAEPVGALAARVGRAIRRPSSGMVAVVLGAAASLLAAWVSTAVLDHGPILLDGISQLVQSRYFAAGRVAGPPLEDPEFWQFQFMVDGDAGWASQYPPGFPALLAVAGRVLPLWMVGPALLGLGIAWTSLAAERLFPDDLVVARTGVALAALSPFLAFHAAAYMSHPLALALVAGALLASLRAARASRTWSLLCGAAVGALFATRPYTGVVLGAFAAVAPWIGDAEARRLPPRWWARHLAAVGAAALPFVAATLVVNRRLFGALTRFGYVAGEGPGHALGFHADPWGNPYGPLEALGYTSADLQGLSLDLLQSLIPVGVVVALYLLCARRVTRGAAAAAVWALLPVAAQALYWHHDLFMGPRLLYESAPGWCLLFAAAVGAALRGAPERAGVFWCVRRGGVAGTLALAAAVAALYAGPAKLRSYRAVAVRSGMALRAPRVEGPALVFVHGSWEDRLAARLAGSGMRIDSIRVALRHNSSCRIERWLDAREAASAGIAGAAAAPAELAFAADPRAPLRDLTMPSGARVRTFEGEALDAGCEREAASDFEGALGLPPLLWRGDLPGLGLDGPMFVRDLGPERNARLLARFPDRTPHIVLSRRGRIVLAAYQDGLRELWVSARP